MSKIFLSVLVQNTCSQREKKKLPSSQIFKSNTKIILRPPNTQRGLQQRELNNGSDTYCRESATP